MQLAQIQWTAGDKRKRTVSYDTFLSVGATIVTATVTCADLTISGIDIVTDPRKVSFFLAGGTANTTLTVTVQITDSIGQVVTDTLELAVGAP